MSFSDLTSCYLLRRGEEPKPREQILETYRQNFEERDYNGETAVNIAAKYADFQALEMLFEMGVRADDTGADSTALMSLAQGNPRSFTPKAGDVYRTAVLLLEHRVSALRKNKSGQTCFHLAARHGNWEFLRALADKNVRLTMTDDSGNNALQIAAEWGGRADGRVIDAKKSFAQASAEVEKARISQDRHLNRLEEKLESSAEECEKESETAENYFKCAEILLESGVDPDEKNRMLQSSLQVAIDNKAKKIAALLSGGLCPDDSPEVRELQLRAGGMTLHQAINMREHDAAQAIIKLGADPDEIGDTKQFEDLTPLMIAVRVGNSEAVELLLNAGANINVKSNAGRHALAQLFSITADTQMRVQKVFPEKHIEKILALAVKAGFDVNSPVDEHSSTLLCLAGKSHYGSSGYNEYFLKNIVGSELLYLGADPDIPNALGETPLMFACLCGYSGAQDMMISLLEQGADVSLKDKNGNTALMYAARAGNSTKGKEAAELLFDFGDPLPAAVNNAGENALDIAVKNNNEPLVKLLLGKI